VKIDSQHSAEEKAKWEVVRRDTWQVYSGETVNSADEETGELSVKVKSQDGAAVDHTYSLGRDGLSIFKKSR
jgi:hypothetical protein